MGRVVATVASGLMYGLIFPPTSWSALSWIALVPFLIAIRGRGALAAAGLAGLLGWVGTLSVIPWLIPTLHEHFGRSLPFSVAFWLLFGTTALAPYYAIGLGAQAWAARRLPRCTGPLLFAAAWTACEFARIQLGFRSPWTRLGDAHAAAPWLRQIADLTGVYGVSALVALGNAVAAEAVLVLRDRVRGRPVAWRRAAIAPAIFAGLLVLALAYGARQSRVHAPEAQADDDFEVAVVQGNVKPELRWRRLTASRVLRRYGGLTRDLLAAAGDDPPDLVVWPENAIQTPVDDPMYGPPLRRLARRSALLVGAPRSTAANGERRHFNSVALLADSRVAGHYDKRRLLPFSETRPFGELGSFGRRGDLDVDEYTPGTEAPLFDVADRSLATLICMEALYPELARAAARRGAGVLVNPSNDGWYRGLGGARQHLEMVVFRAVETRLPVVRATTTGVSAVVAADGSILESLGEGETGVVRARLPEAPRRASVYVRIGDVFAWSCAAALALAVGAAAGRAREGHARSGVPSTNPPERKA